MVVMQVLGVLPSKGGVVHRGGKVAKVIVLLVQSDAVHGTGEGSVRSVRYH